MDRESEQEQVKSRTTERAAPTQPGKASEKESEEIERHALAERLKAVEEKFERSPLRRAWLLLRKPASHEINMLVEE
jgi:hypothetical protein